MLSFQEFFDIILMSAVLGFLFKDMLKSRNDDPLQSSKKKDFLYATAIVAPSIILHELAHKFVAISFGLHATFHAFYADPTTLFLGILAIIAKLTGFGFVFLVPGFVRVIGVSMPLERAAIAFAGPLVHALFYFGATLYIKYKKNMSKKEMQFAFLTKQINGFLFILNMLPIPGIDGFNLYTALFDAF